MARSTVGNNPTCRTRGSDGASAPETASRRTTQEEPIHVQTRSPTLPSRQHLAGRVARLQCAHFGLRRRGRGSAGRRTFAAYPRQAAAAGVGPGLQEGCGGGGQPLRRRSWREDPRARWQRGRCRGGHRLRAQCRRAAIGRCRRRRLHDDPPGAQRPHLLHRHAREGPGRRHARHVRRRAEFEPAGRGRGCARHGARHRRCDQEVRQARSGRGAAAGHQAGRRGLRRHAALRRGQLQQPLAELARIGGLLLPRRRRAGGRVAGAEQAAWRRPSG